MGGREQGSEGGAEEEEGGEGLKVLLPVVEDASVLDRLAEDLDLKGPRPESLEQGIAKLVLTLVETLRKVLEKQALRKFEAGELSSEDIERVGLAFMQIKRKVRELSGQLGVPPGELDLNLGSLLKVSEARPESVSLADVLDKLLEKGTVACGQVRISVADVDLVGLNLLASLS